MADTKITGLTAGAVPDGTEITNVVQGGNPVQMPLTMLRSQMSAVSVASQSPAAASTTYLTNSSITVPVSKLRIGTYFKWRVIMTKTGAGTLASSFLVKGGTLGTTGDTTLGTHSIGAGTAVADTAWVDIVATIRGPLSSSGIIQSSMTMQHSLQNTGFSVLPTIVTTATSASFDVTTANLIIGLAWTAGTSQAATMVQVIAEAVNVG